MMGISQAAQEHGWLKDYMWKNVSPDTDEFTSRARETPHEGYFIRSLPGVKASQPVQSCLYIAKDGFSQHVHQELTLVQVMTTYIIPREMSLQ